MSWFKVDDGWWSHPKTLQLSDAAISLWTRAGSWSCQHLTDGRITDPVLKVLGGSKRAVDELVKAGYWDVVDGGWTFHDWADYQEHSDVVKKRREDARERMRTVRANRQRTSSERSQEVRSTPTRPDPTRPNDSSTKSQSAAKRGTRIHSAFAITPEMREWARKDVPLVNIDAKLPEFIDYWTGVAGEKGVKLDWEATWRNGMRKQQGFAERDRPAGTPSPRRVVSGRG
jgi:hypothetical protein